MFTVRREPGLVTSRSVLTIECVTAVRDMPCSHEELEALLILLEHFDYLDATLELHASGTPPTERSASLRHVTHRPSVNFILTFTCYRCALKLRKALQWVDDCGRLRHPSLMSAHYTIPMPALTRQSTSVYLGEMEVGTLRRVMLIHSPESVRSTREHLPRIPRGSMLVKGQQYERKSKEMNRDSQSRPINGGTPRGAGPASRPVDSENCISPLRCGARLVAKTTTVRTWGMSIA